MKVLTQDGRLLSEISTLWVEEKSDGSARLWGSARLSRKTPSFLLGVFPTKEEALEELRRFDRFTTGVSQLDKSKVFHVIKKEEKHG